MKPARGPWGGSSAFVQQLSHHLKSRGYRVRYDLEGDIDLIVLIDPRVDKLKPYAHEQIAAYRRAHPGVKVLHRVNECDQRKDTAFMDDLLHEASAVADVTVFISDWLRRYFVERWFDPARPHRVIYNGADPAVFHPIGKARWKKGREPLRLITHHWSNHMLKGFDVYEQVDHLIADGSLKDVQLVVMGRWPDGIEWKSAELIPSQRGAGMARVLRSAHAYLTASRWEPCGMHHVEGAQCGLPLVYHEDGGGIVEAGERYGIGFRDDPAGAIRRFMQDYETYQQRLLRAIPSGDRMCLDFLDTIQEMLALRDGQGARHDPA
jgi:glycosyltransferase involved in cell wall biosynthesis